MEPEIEGIVDVHPLRRIADRVIPRGGPEQRGPRFPFAFSRGRQRGSHNPPESSDNQRSVPEPTSAAKGAPPTSVSNPVRVDRPLEHADADKAPVLTEPQNPDPRHPLSPLKWLFSTSSARLRSRFSRGNSSGGEPHGQGPEDAGTPVVVQDPAPHQLDDTHSSSPVSRTKKAIAFVKATLQVVAAGLKAAPIPNLDQIPRILLLLLDIHEVCHLAKSTSQVTLNDPSNRLDRRRK